MSSKYSSTPVIVAVLLLVCTIAISAGNANAQNSLWGQNYFPNVPLTTQDGTTVHFYDDLLKGKIVAIDLIYTHCADMCPLETARLAQVQKMLGDRVGKDIFFYSISIDPKRDTPKILKAYAEKYHAGNGWLFLTGKKEDVDLISKKIGLYSDPDPANRDGHTAYLLLGNEATGQWIRNSAVDNPRFLAIMIGDWLNSWKNSATPKASYANAPALAMNDPGKYLFATHCSACHTIGHGDSIGPDLLGATSEHSRDWLVRYISAPDKMLESKDKEAVALFNKYQKVKMPNLQLGQLDVEALVSYLGSVSAPKSANASRSNGSGVSPQR